MAHSTPENKNIDSRKATRRRGGAVTETDLDRGKPAPPAAQPSGSKGAQRFEDETILPGMQQELEKGKQPASTDGAQTRRFGARGGAGGGMPAPEIGGALPKSMETPEFSDAPVVGWLVIIDGPGRGRAKEIVAGRNVIGRGAGNDIGLNFGDSQISREKHAVVSYDPRGRRFYLQHGEGANLTYLNDEPVLSPCEIKALSQITLGDTVLCFVPFCGDDFDWQDKAGDEEA